MKGKIKPIKVSKEWTSDEREQVEELIKERYRVLDTARERLKNSVPESVLKNISGRAQKEKTKLKGLLEKLKSSTAKELERDREQFSELVL